MRKIFLALFTCMLLFVGNKSQAQLTVTMSSVTVDSSQNASVDVTVAGFTNLAGVTFSVNWDSLVLDYVNTTNFSTSPVALSISNIGPPGQGIIKKGQLTFSWDDSAGRTLPNGTRLFTLVFKAIGTKCSTTDVVTSSTPTNINITYGDFVTEDQNLVNVKGVVTIDCGGNPPNPCPNPICTNPSNLTFSAPTVTAQTGDEICIPISVKNFTNINSGQGAFTWNPALLRYTGATVPSNGLPEMGNTLNENDSLGGKITFVWVPDNTLPKTLPDGTVIIELCFKVLGAPDSKACLLMGQGSPETIWSTEQVASVPTCYNYGMVCVTDEVDNPTLRIKTGNGTGRKGDTVCINVTVDSLINGLSFRTEFNWNQTQLKYIRTDGYNLQGLTMSMFNNSPSDKLIVAWSNPNPVSLQNGTAIFQICFEVLVCETNPINSPITITGVTEGSALINGNPTSIDVVATGGIITIIPCVDPVVNCTPGAVTNVTCNGGSNGSALLAVTGNTADCTCLWKNSAGTIVKAAGPVASGCNLTGVPAGTYTYEVSCGGKVSCSGTATITQPTPINIPTVGVVTNVGCGQNGSINISTTSGGTPPYTYTWNPNLGNTPNPTNLSPGSYSVTVTDANQCTATTASPFVVGDTQGELVVTATSTNIKCKDAGNGTITVTVSGGCPTYTYVWSNPQLVGPNPQNVRPGTYTVTVTDGSNPVESRTATVTITEPASNPSIAVTNITGTPMGSSVGTITLTITGGTAPYGTSWSGPTTIAPGNTSSVITASNLAAGFYNVTVTDANGCTAIIGNPIEVPTMTDPPKAPVATASITTIINGRNVPCFGDNTAVIRVSFSAGTPPITVKLFKNNQEIRSQAVTTPTFDFTGLDAGSYRVEYSNTAGAGTPIDLVVTQPTRLAATQKVECTEKNGATGTIEISLNNTGTAPYSFNWFGLSENSNRVTDLPADAYNVTVTDANGCTLTVTNIEVKDCSIEGPCYEASTIISPNGDNFNDVFLINCVTDNPSDLTVFDRWGRVVYSQSNYDNTWQGIDNSGKDLIESSYMWVLTVNFGQGRKEVQKGTVTLLRTR